MSDMHREADKQAGNPGGSVYVPGDVLLLLSQLQDLQAGLYVVHSVANDWATLNWLVDDEQTERLIVTDRVVRLPLPLLEFFMPVGIHLRSFA